MRRTMVPLRLVLLGTLLCRKAWAGPPFLTDDPEPVEFKHWEFYAATQWSAAHHAASGTSPHFEVNYGALPGLQLHAIIPATLAWTRGEPAKYGVGDVELGTKKLRFVDEGEWRPQVGKSRPLSSVAPRSSPLHQVVAVQHCVHRAHSRGVHVGYRSLRRSESSGRPRSAALS